MLKTKTITTSKGEFVVVDMEHNSWFQNTPIPEGYTTEEFIKLSKATGEDAANIVDNGIFKGFYTFDGWGESEDPRLTLNCLLKSKGIDINNGNWYLFKKI